ncbi:MAG TPA: SDR family oxidoreductase [Polyangiaceae bacterium]|jgi:NAD(P)-dependent dehydrogenase (short-subunit alcohol dehydrogenase family)|nr:SDR family oxidoreductase [Polyangiaceae bacterium]
MNQQKTSDAISTTASALPLKDQRVVIVGGTSGMGLGAARAAASAGAHVIVAGRRGIAEREATSSADRFEHVVLDVTDEAAVHACFEAIGELHHLFVTATPSAELKPFLEQDFASAQRFMNGKFFGSLACALHAAPRTRAGGSITFLTGCASIRPSRGRAMATATFAALEALSQSLALELGPLRVNTIRPGVIDSDMWDFLDEAQRKQFRTTVAKTMPAGRIGHIEDIGHAAVFLMTNPYVTGAVLEVSGGEPLITLDL